MNAKKKEIGEILKEIYFELSNHFSMPADYEFIFAPTAEDDLRVGMVLADEKKIL